MHCWEWIDIGKKCYRWLHIKNDIKVQYIFTKFMKFSRTICITLLKKSIWLVHSKQCLHIYLFEANMAENVFDRCLKEMDRSIIIWGPLFYIYMWSTQVKKKWFSFILSDTSSSPCSGLPSSFEGLVAWCLMIQNELTGW